MTKTDAYPEWMVIKQGKLILTDDEFAILASKYGITGTGSVTQEVAKVFGGPGAVKISTTAINGAFESIKRSISNYFDNQSKIAVELKYIPDPQFGANQLRMGFELFIAAIGQLEGGVIYDQATKSIQIQTGPGTYAPLDPPLIVQQPEVQTVTEGDLYGWIRIVIDLKKREFVSIESHGLDKREFRGVKGIPLVNVGVTTLNALTVGISATNAGGSITDTYMTDLAVSVV